jgi:hypothetical protein
VKIGTKSILFGAHQFMIHPWFVAWAWWRLYGFPWDPRLWVAFFVHDLGYWGKPNMDGPEGETHVELGADIMHYLFDGYDVRKISSRTSAPSECALFNSLFASGYRGGFNKRRQLYWYDFCVCHSRFYAKKLGLPYSRLCAADKLSISLTPWWIYLPLVNLTGEIHEYMSLSEAKEGAKYLNMRNFESDQRKWHKNMCNYLRDWALEHRDGREDTWTPDQSTVSGGE